MGRVEEFSFFKCRKFSNLLLLRPALNNFVSGVASGRVFKGCLGTSFFFKVPSRP